MRIAVTGAGGQIGFRLAKWLATHLDHAEVVAVTRNSLQAKKLAGSACTVRVGSIEESQGAAQLLKDCDVVVHCALSWESLTHRDSPNMAMIRALAQTPARLFIFLSTISVYSSCIEAGRNTFEHPRPDDDYGRDKLLCEAELARRFGDGRIGITLRLGPTYGPFERFSRRIIDCLNDPSFRLPFGGRRLSNAARIDRVCAAVAGLIQRPLDSGVYNLTDDPHLTWKDVFDWHSKLCALPEASLLDDYESSRLREQFLMRKRKNLSQLGRELILGSAAAATQIISSSELLKSAASATLGRLPDSWEVALKKRYLHDQVQREIDAVGARSSWEPWTSILFSDPAPGTYLPAYPSTIGDRDQIDHELIQWYTRWAFPDGMWRDEAQRSTYNSD
jgi:nucleoside-diphosphate-sugar epimerase